jgi:signal peptidase II
VAPDAPGGRRRAVLTMALLAVAIIAADLASKQLVTSHLDGHRPVRLLGGAVYLVLTRNGGAAFSIGSRYTFVFPIIALAVVGWIGWLAVRLRSVAWALALGLVLGGAAGNLGDRLFRAPGFLVGHVVDFISVFADDGHVFPVFNIADSALSVGVVVAVVLELLGRRRDGTTAAARQ